MWKFKVGLGPNPMAKDHTKPERKKEHFPFSDQEEGNCTVSITVVGASGCLAKAKIFPTLFALYYEDLLPKVLFMSLTYSHILLRFTSPMCLFHGNG